MGVRWNTYVCQLIQSVVLIVAFGIQGCLSLNPEGLALLEFKARITFDPHASTANWNPDDESPCEWRGIGCVNGEVHNVDLHGLCLRGTLAPELGKLHHLRFLLLSKNQFNGTIPKEVGDLLMLELLDLENNCLSGTIPAEIGRMASLKRLLLCDNKFEGSIPLELGQLHALTELQFDENLTSTISSGTSCANRKFGHWFSFPTGAHGRRESSCENSPSSFHPHIDQITHSQSQITRRRLLGESTNLQAEPASGGPSLDQLKNVPITRSSGAFLAVPNEKQKQSPPPAFSPSPSTGTISTNGTTTSGQSSGNSSSENTWKYALIGSGVGVLLIVAVVMIFMCRSKGVTTIGPWKTGISGQLQKAFVTGVPKLNRPELEVACEDFSNVIDTVDGCTIFKGTLSSGVEIAVASCGISSAKDWTKGYEMMYRRKIDTLSRVNHKNFVNLIGYCEEDEEPFIRMMVFEYAPNGTLFEHLHVKEVEHLDWNARTRIIMGVSYCLTYMHSLNPPVAHPNLNSTVIFLTDDYAAKISDANFWTGFTKTSKVSGEEESNHSELPPLADPETNVYSFGILLLEIISGKVPQFEEKGSLVNWAAEYLNDKRSISYMIDPTLKSFKDNELDVICEVIQDCIQPDPRKRSTMTEITAKLREVIAISPDAATPRLSPLWWAELEILSVEAS